MTSKRAANGSRSSRFMKMGPKTDDVVSTVAQHQKMARRIVVALILYSASLLSAPVASLPIQSTDKNWEQGTVRTLHVAVKHSNQHELEPLLQAVSDPASPDYGNYLSLDDICKKFSPRQADVDAVIHWAEMHGAFDIQLSACNEHITVKMPTKNLAQAFHGSPELACSALSGCNRAAAVPPSLKLAIDFVDGLGKDLLSTRGEKASRNYSPAERRRASSTPSTEAFRQVVEERESYGGEDEVAKPVGPWYPPCLKTSATPPCLRELHNVSATKGTDAGNSQGVALFGPQFYSPSDLAQFQKEYKVPPVTIHDLNDNDPATPGNEASLDVQYITGMGAGVPSWYMHYTCTTQECHPFLTWILQIANTSNPPLVQSISVGTTEYEYVEEMGDKFVKRINEEFMKAGVRGISLLFATGDKASQIHEKKYWINFPSASPFVTAVGGVWLGVLGGGPLETDPDTTGGFSNCAEHVRQKYQDDAVQNYLIEAAAEKAAQPPVFNASNRGVPDLVSMSDAYVIIQHGAPTFIGGTSAACPVVAGLFSLINDARLAAGKPSLGFLNPLLYANPQCFEDIVGGSNLYGATKGWDPASGLGSPVFPCLLQAAMK